MYWRISNSVFGFPIHITFILRLTAKTSKSINAKFIFNHDADESRHEMYSGFRFRHTCTKCIFTTFFSLLNKRRHFLFTQWINSQSLMTSLIYAPLVNRNVMFVWKKQQQTQTSTDIVLNITTDFTCIGHCRRFAKSIKNVGSDAFKWNNTFVECERRIQKSKHYRDRQFGNFKSWWTSTC